MVGCCRDHRCDPLTSRNSKLIHKILTGLTGLSLTLALTSCGSGGIEIENKGSDTLLEVAASLAQAYGDLHPEIAISVSGGGSGGGIASLIGGDLDIANSSRALKPKEIEEANKRNIKPQDHVVGWDGIAIFVHKENPIESLTLAQLKAMFADGGKIENWTDIGIDFGTGDADNNIVLVSRQNSSGTYECFLNKVLGKGSRFKARCNNLNSSKDVVDLCTKSKSAIGYSGLAYATDDVRVVPIISAEGKPAILPSIDTVLDRSYGISRPLYMYTNEGCSKEISDYLDWIKGPAGQKVMLEEGYVPLVKPK